MTIKSLYFYYCSRRIVFVLKASSSFARDFTRRRPSTTTTIDGDDDDDGKLKTGSMPRAAPAPAPCVAAHDAANVPILFTIASLCTASLLAPARVDAWVITVCFIAYVLVDTVWIAVAPQCVPRAARAVLAHHAVTLCLLACPALRPERAAETCRNGLVEWNTLFLILRRRRGAMRIWNALYAATLVPIRFAWQPYLVVRFWRLTRDDAAWERALVVGAQVFLVGFNVYLVFGKKVEKKTTKAN